MAEEIFCSDKCPSYYQLFLSHLDASKEFRERIYKYIELENARRILEVGTRVGYIAKEIRNKASGQITAIDSNHMLLAEAMENVDGVEFFRETGTKLSMRNNSFDIVMNHFYFIWFPKSFSVLMELVRVCKKGGFVVALTEPDLGGWIEYPENYLGKYHLQTIEKNGGLPDIGRRLYAIFTSAGLKTQIFTFLQFLGPNKLKDYVSQSWKFLFEQKVITEEEYSHRLEKEMEYIENNIRIIAVPIFAAVGKKVEDINVKKLL